MVSPLFSKVLKALKAEVTRNTVERTAALHERFARPAQCKAREKLYLALEKSYLCCFAEVDVEYETRALDVNNNSVESTVVETRREIIGFGRMTSDAAFVATVWDLVVAPPYQGKGIGTAIVERMIGKAKENAPGMVVNLCAVEDAVKMYKRIGFQRDEKEIIAMQFNPELQAMQHFRSVDFSI